MTLILVRRSASMLFMKLTILALLCFYQTKANNLIIKSNDCSLLLKQREAICSWKKSIDKDFNWTPIRSCHRSTSGGHYLNVSTCLPKFVKKNQNKRLLNTGANCWGTALSFKGISKRPRFVWTEEIMYWQDSPLCKKIATKDELKPGDIINVYGPEYVFARDEISKGTKFWNALYPNRYTTSPVQSGYSGYHNFLHSETYISSELTFGKESPNKLDRFTFRKMTEVYGRSRDEYCQENQSLTPHIREYQKEPKSIKGSKCDYFSIAYRCQNLDEYLREQNLTLFDQENLVVIKDLSDIQDRLFELQKTSDKFITGHEIKRIVSLADKISAKSLSELSNTVLSKTSEMILTQKYFTAQGVRKALEQALLIPNTEVL